MIQSLVYGDAEPRLTIYIILCECEEALNLMGPECGSWGIPARGTSKRTYINPLGAMELGFVAEIHQLVLRLVLCLLLMMAKHTYFVLEQPANSLLQKAHRFETFMNHTCYEPLVAIILHIKADVN